MAITSDLDNIVKWFEEEVCPSILLKVPDDKVNDGGYNVQTAHPAAFAMYIPTQDRKPPDVAAPIPSLDLKGAVVADTVYDSGVLTAKDTSFTLPAISQMTADLNAMGTMTVPIVGLLENMELSITKIGEDKGLGKMSKLDKHSFEFRWVQNVVKADGSTSPEGCKAFVRTFPPTALPGIGAEIGSASENELTYTANRVQIFVGGYEYLLVDRLSQILRIDGKDYMSDINKLL